MSSNPVKSAVQKFGLPRIIIVGFFIFLVIAAGGFQMNLMQYAGDELIWSGETEKSLGYIHLNVKPVLTNEITIRLKGASKEGDGFGQIVEVAAPAAGELDLFKAKNGDKTNHELRIVEIEFKENLWQ